MMCFVPGFLLLNTKMLTLSHRHNVANVTFLPSPRTDKTLRTSATSSRKDRDEGVLHYYGSRLERVKHTHTHKKKKLPSSFLSLDQCLSSSLAAIAHTSPVDLGTPPVTALPAGMTGVLAGLRADSNSCHCLSLSPFPQV